MHQLAGYSHFARVAERLRWDEAVIDLAPDADDWPRLDPERRRRTAAFVAAFVLAERRVAVDLDPFAEAAPDPEMARCFRLQAHDEERHARFFRRYASRVMGSTSLDDLVEPGFAALFEERLARTARSLGRGEATLGEAVGLYHLVLEGVVFSAGQRALEAELANGRELPGLREGLERVAADERWHIGFGARVAQDSGLDEEARSALERDGAAAADAWGPLLPRRERDAAIALHRRRLAAAGLLPR